MNHSLEMPLSLPQLMLLFQRLEAATSRLEDMATAVDPSKPLNATVAAAEAESLAAKEADGAETRSASAPAAVQEPLPKTIEDFDKILKEDVQGFVTASEKLGGLIQEQVRSPSTLPVCSG
jgi:adenylyl cyclase-associated protein